MLDAFLPYILPLVGAALAALGAKLLGEKRWRDIRDRALQLLGDPSRPDITEPKQAVTEAMMMEQLDRLTKEIAKVREAFVLPPLVKIDPDGPLGGNGHTPPVGTPVIGIAKDKQP